MTDQVGIFEILLRGAALGALVATASSFGRIAAS